VPGLSVACCRLLPMWALVKSSFTHALMLVDDGRYDISCLLKKILNYDQYVRSVKLIVILFVPYLIRG
jgi:hypothetical protein